MNTEILMAAQGLKSSQSKQSRLTQQQQSTGPRAVWPCWLQHSMAQWLPKEMPVDLSMLPFKGEHCWPCLRKRWDLWLSPFGFPRQTRRHILGEKLENMMAVLFVESTWNTIKTYLMEREKKQRLLSWIIILWFIHLVRFIESQTVGSELCLQTFFPSQLHIKHIKNCEDKVKAPPPPLS